MVYPLRDAAAFSRQLVASYRMRTTVQLLRLSDSKVLSTLSEELLDGQVDIDSTAETTRSATLTISDPDRSFGLDSNSPGEGAVYMDRMVRITYGVWVVSLNRWVDVPIFTGPITSMARNGAELQMTCMGKEHLAKGQLWTPMKIKRGADKVETIRSLLRKTGETRFAFPAKGGRMPNLSLGRLAQPWVEAQNIAASMNRQLYYDGNGVCRLRRRPTRKATPVWTFKAGDGGTVLAAPEVSFDASTAKNRVWVLGKKKPSKPRITYVATAPRNHPLSPLNLGRSGKPRYLVEVVENDKINTKKQARQVATDRLSQLLMEGVEVQFTALPVPHLDPLDPVALRTSDASISFLLRKVTVPLTHDGSMTVGENRQVPVRRRRRR